jgi:hypothetical protein
VKRKLELYSLPVLALALAFDWFFEFSKHNAVLRPIIPFGDDPYDAAGSFCLITCSLLAGLSLFRALRAYSSKESPPHSGTFLARTQMVVPLGILATVGADAIAMMRHAPQWAARPGAAELLALLAGMGALALAVLLLVPKAASPGPSPSRGSAFKRAAVTIAFSGFVLAVFPDEWIQSLPVHLLAILIGFVVVAATQAELAVAILPYSAEELEGNAAASGRQSKRWVAWVAVILCGAVIGGATLVAEIRESGLAHGMQALAVALVYVGAGICCLLIAFGFHRTPLGLSRRSLSG